MCMYLKHSEKIVKFIKLLYFKMEDPAFHDNHGSFRFVNLKTNFKMTVECRYMSELIENSK